MISYKIEKVTKRHNLYVTFVPAKVTYRLDNTIKNHNIYAVFVPSNLILGNYSKVTLEILEGTNLLIGETVSFWVTINWAEKSYTPCFSAQIEILEEKTLRSIIPPTKMVGKDKVNYYYNLDTSNLKRTKYIAICKVKGNKSNITKINFSLE